MLSVPSILEDMLNLPDGIGIEALKNLEIVAVGGAPMKESTGRELVEHGVKLLNHWGTSISQLLQHSHLTILLRRYRNQCYRSH